MARGKRREAIFMDDDDRRFFLHPLAQACERTGWRVHAWVLMGEPLPSLHRDAGAQSVSRHEGREQRVTPVIEEIAEAELIGRRAGTRSV